MTTPASDCGVTAGCGACPLGRAGVCGDPVPSRVGDIVRRTPAATVPTDVLQFVDRRYGRVWNRDVAGVNGPGMWQCPNPSVAWGEAYLAHECGPLTVTDVAPRSERAGVCGDPGTEPLAAGDYPRGWAVSIPPLQVGRGDNGHGVPAHDLGDPHEALARVLAQRGYAPPFWVEVADGVLLAPMVRADDNPDRDPAEPRPADAGCCGGACSA